MKIIKRYSIAALLITAGLATSAAAWADAPAKPQCDGHEHHGDKGARFKQADKNGDGFLTKDEVGDKRWERIKVADANGDDKVSQAELRQAHEDGKLGHRHGSKS